MSRNLKAFEGEILEAYTSYGRQGAVTVLIERLKDSNGKPFLSTMVIPATPVSFMGATSMEWARKNGVRMAREQLGRQDRIEVVRRIVRELVESL